MEGGSCGWRVDRGVWAWVEASPIRHGAESVCVVVDHGRRAAELR